MLSHFGNKSIRNLDLLVFTLLTALAIWNEQTTVFYLLYLFWWNEFIRKIFGYFFNKPAANRDATDKFGSFFLLGLYFVFIIVFFLFIANWQNKEMLFLSLEVLLFKNWFFNANLLWIVLEHIWLQQRKNKPAINLSPFSANAVVLHISIIIGGLLMFLVVNKYPVFFQDNTRLGALIMALPFLLLRLAAQLMAKETEAEAKSLEQ